LYIKKIILEYKVNYFSSILHVKRKLSSLVLLFYHFSMNYYTFPKPTSNQIWYLKQTIKPSETAVDPLSKVVDIYLRIPTKFSLQFYDFSLKRYSISKLAVIFT
jgi:hypothetical protein